MTNQNNYIKIEISDENLVLKCENLIKIDNVSVKNLCFNDFFWKYMNANLPVVINSISNDWESSKNWTTTCTKTKRLCINFDYLKTTIPNIKVPVDNCSSQYYNSHEKLEIYFWEFLDYWKSRNANEDGLTMEGDKSPLYYLKDWHLKKDFPGYDYYEVPLYFVSDWLNEYLIDSDKDDYMFVYMGPKGTWTPFHSDVFSSYSWSTNIVGRKKWLILPYGEEIKLKDSFGNLPYTIDEEILDKSNVKYFEIIQNPNEAIFVPTGWHHQVWNLEDTISINHNWFNSCNITIIWTTLKSSLLTIRKEIDNCRDMENYEEHCQVMLKSLVGLDFKGFYDLIKFILDKRRKAIETGKTTVLFEKFELGLKLLIHDIKILQQILDDFLKHEDVKLLISLNKCFLD